MLRILLEFGEITSPDKHGVMPLSVPWGDEVIPR